MSWDGSAWSYHPEVQGYYGGMFSDGSDLWICGYVGVDDPSSRSFAFSIIRYSGGFWHDLVSWNDHMRGLTTGFDTANVLALAEYRGHMIASGYFRYAGDPPGWLETKGLAEWDGSRWQNMASPPSLSGYSAGITAMLARGDTLYVGGAFLDSTNTTTPVYRLTGNQWTPMGHSSFQPEALTISRGRLYAAGRGGFNFPDTTGIYEWDGTNWLLIGEADGFYSSVSSLGEWEGKLIAAGGFSAVDGVPATGIAAWDGDHWEQFGNPLPGFSNFPFGIAMAVYQGEVIMTGSLGCVLRWNGSAWEIMGSLIADDAAPLIAGGELFVGGYLRDASPPHTQIGIAHWKGNEWEELGSGTNGPVNAVLAHGGALYVGGAFTTAGGKGSYSIARWDGLPAPVVKAALLPAAPNPFRASTTFSYTLPASGSVRVSVFDLRGREVVVLQKGSPPQGVHAVTWDGRDEEGRVLPAGVYFLRADLPGGEFSRKIVHLR